MRASDSSGRKTANTQENRCTNDPRARAPSLPEFATKKNPGTRPGESGGNPQTSPQQRAAARRGLIFSAQTGKPLH